MRYDGPCNVLDCGRPGRDYDGTGEEILCWDHYRHDRTRSRRRTNGQPRTLQPFTLAQRIASRYPVLASRALRAAQLVAAGKVHLDTTCHRVASQTGAGEYRVTQVNGTWCCTCPDWQKGSAPIVGRGPKCKHILAVMMAIKLEGGKRRSL